MYFISSAHHEKPKTLSEAIHAGLASDGGLYVPEIFPSLNLSAFTASLSYPDFAQLLLQPFFKQDPLEKHLASFCKKAFYFPLPLKSLDSHTAVLELFHGPTLSFKDFGARFLAECLNQLSEKQKTTIMVATSGDTGSAVASAFHLKPNLQVIVLYPKGKISQRQEHQMTCWGNNVLALAIEGNFDDCQSLVKAAFKNSVWQEHLHLSSANSINIGRLLPQITYYAHASVQFFHQHQKAPGFIIPTGNLGNATAAYWAKLLGFPIREIVLATNANLVIPDYIKTGTFKPRPSIPTLANAMDVGNPSNFERLRHLYPDFKEFKHQVQAWSATDDDIRHTIQEIYKKYRYLICPHTATAFFARKHLSQDQDWIVIATADPCKFEEIIEPLLNVSVPVPPQLKELLNKPSQIITVKANLEEVRQVLKMRGLY